MKNMSRIRTLFLGAIFASLSFLSLQNSKAVEADCFVLPSNTVSAPCPSDTKFTGTMVLPASTSISLIAANVTMDPNSTSLPLPGQFTRLTIIAPINSTFNICWLGGTCSATIGEAIGQGTNVASDTINLMGNSNAPTFFSTAGATLTFRN